MLNEAKGRSFLRYAACEADPSEAPMNRWSPYFLSTLRIVAAFVHGVRGTQKLFGFPAPFPVPHLPPLFLAGGMIDTFGG